MGQKVNPKIFRIGITQQWDSRWYGNKKVFGTLLRQDLELKKFIATNLKDAGVARVEIERSSGAVTIIIHAAKPGVVIGRGGQGIEDIKKKIQKTLLPPKTNLHINIQEVTNPNYASALVAQGIAADIEKRIPFRRAMKQALSKVEKTDAKGVKVTVAGRLNGSEIARTETLSVGQLPLHTLRADIDYAFTEARTTYGVIGIKVWIYKGIKFKQEKQA